MPVMAAAAVMSTARPSHASQVMTNDSIHVDPTLRTPLEESGSLVSGHTPLTHYEGCCGRHLWVSRLQDRAEGGRTRWHGYDCGRRGNAPEKSPMDLEPPAVESKAPSALLITNQGSIGQRASVPSP